MYLEATATSLDVFKLHFKYNVGSGDNAFFWLNLWWGALTFQFKFASLLRVVRDKKALVDESFEWIANELDFSSTFWRNINEVEFQEFVWLLNLM